jgi:hypothetical protein
MTKPLPLPSEYPRSGDADALLAPTARTGAELLQSQFEAEREAIVQTAVLLARRGDMAALRLILDRIAPMPRGRAVNLSLPKIESVGDVPAAHGRLVELVASGELTLHEAGAIAKVLGEYVAGMQATDHEERLTTIEKSIGESRASYHGK